MAAKKKSLGTARKGRAADDAWARREYAISMAVKRGDLVWDPSLDADRFGSPGGYVPTRPHDASCRIAESGACRCRPAEADAA